MIGKLKHPGGDRTLYALAFLVCGFYFLITGLMKPGSILVIMGATVAAVGTGLWFWQSWARWSAILVCWAYAGMMVRQVVQGHSPPWYLLIVGLLLWGAWDIWRRFHPRERGGSGGLPQPSRAELQGAIEQFRRPIQTSEDYDQRKKAGEVITRAGQAGVSDLLGLLRDGDEDLADSIGRVLRKLGGPALRALMQIIPVSEGPVLHRRLRALWEFEEEGAQAIPVLLTVMASKDPLARERAVHALARMGPECAKALPQILVATRDEDPEVRWSAAYALQRSGKTTGEVRGALAGLLRDSEARVRAIAVDAFGKLFPGSLPPGDVLQGLLCDPDTDVLKEVFEWIGELGPKAPDVTPELARALQNPEIDLAAAGALWAHARRPDLVMPVILRHLSTKDRCMPETASDLIAEMGPAAQEAVPRLVDLLKENDYDLQWAVSDALAAIGPAAAEGVSLLIKHLDHESGTVASSTAHALAKVGAVAFPAVFEILKTGSPRAKEFAADCLGRMGDEAEEALPILMHLVEEASSPADLRYWAWLALGEIRPIPEATQPMAGLLEDGFPSDMRIRAAQVLGRIGPEALAAKSALQKASADSNERIARAALEALASIGG